MGLFISSVRRAAPSSLLPSLLLSSLLGNVLLGSAVAAPALDAAGIVQKAADAQRAAKTLSFRVSGVVSDDTGKQKLDVKVQTIPASNVARLTFNAPDALADNIMVVTPTELRQYLYLSNQVMVTPLKSARLPAGGAAGGLDMSALDFTQIANPAQQLSRYDLKLLGTAGAAPGRLFQLQALPKAGTGKLLVWITENGWRPTRVQAFDPAGKLQADLNFADYVPNAPLTVSKLSALPKDAEVLRQ